MSFLVDPPLLVASGAAIGRWAPDEETARTLERATAALFLGASVPLYANAPWMHWFARAFGCESGRDLMLNSKVTRFEHERPPPWVHGLAAAIFLTYPLWLRLGLRLGARRR